MDNEVKLLPCPMCGGKAKPAARGQIRPMAMRPEDYIVHCEQCWVGTHPEASNAIAAAAWNKRDSAALEVALEAQAKVERFEAMLEKAVYIEFDQWAIYNNYPFAKKPGDGKIRLFKKNETNQSFDVREFDSVLEAYEARETFEATQEGRDG